MSKNTERVKVNDERVVAGEFKARFPSSGHIPGGTTVVLENDGKKPMYTGDINLQDSQLLKGADTDFGELDAVITESTYSQVDHEPREKIETEFVSFANEVVERGGVLLFQPSLSERFRRLPAFLGQGASNIQSPWTEWH